MQNKKWVPEIFSITNEISQSKLDYETTNKKIIEEVSARF